MQCKGSWNRALKLTSSVIWHMNPLHICFLNSQREDNLLCQPWLYYEDQIRGFVTVFRQLSYSIYVLSQDSKMIWQFPHFIFLFFKIFKVLFQLEESLWRIWQNASKLWQWYNIKPNIFTLTDNFTAYFSLLYVKISPS